MTLPYASPNEERAPSGDKHKRRGGRGFYADRGRQYKERDLPGHSNYYRDRNRTPDEREVARLARELGGLAEQYPRFRDSLFRLQHHVLIQVRSAEWKMRKVVGALHDEPALVEEIIEDTGLDKQSAKETLELLAVRGSAEKCNRDGAPVLIRKDGKPAERVYWRRGQRSEVRGQGQTAGAGGR